MSYQLPVTSYQLPVACFNHLSKFSNHHAGSHVKNLRVTWLRS